jgi:hypothetical protein
MANPEHLRELAARVFAIAIRSKDVEFARHLRATRVGLP